MTIEARTAAHTPGPWEHDGRFVYALQHNGAFNPDSSPVMVNRFSALVEPGWPRPNVTEMHANARLISAAPELLDGSNELLNVVIEIEAVLRTVPYTWARMASEQLTAASRNLFAATAKAEGRDTPQAAWRNQ